MSRFELGGLVLGPAGAAIADPASWGPLLAPLLGATILAVCVLGYRAAWRNV